MLAALMRLFRRCPCPACSANRGDLAAVRNLVVAAYPGGVAVEFDVRRPGPNVVIMTRGEARRVAAAIVEAVDKGAQAVGRDT